MNINKNNIPVAHVKKTKKQQSGSQVKNFVELLHKNFNKYTKYCELTKINLDGTKEFVIIPVDQIHSIPFEERQGFVITDTFEKKVMA